MRLKQGLAYTSSVRRPSRADLPMNQKNLNYEIETKSYLCRLSRPGRSMNQKNLNYEIETTDAHIAKQCGVSTMNQKNLNYEIETQQTTKRNSPTVFYESKESQL